jgi:hypothetical protein
MLLEQQVSWLVVESMLFSKTSSDAIGLGMKVVVQLSKKEEAKALPILLRHSAGIVLAQRKYILSEDALRALRKAGVRFSEFIA